MKNKPKNNLVSKLNRIKEDLRNFEQPELKSTIVKNLDGIIDSLSRLRTTLTNPDLDKKVTEIMGPLEQVIGFLELAKSEESIKTLLLLTEKNVKPKVKREQVEIPNNLTNEQIRKLLEIKLSRDELKSIAEQRAISVGKNTIEEIKKEILRNLERQEGYSRLSSL